ncbi:MAG: hypothetical protein KGQ37_01640 [Hyphomicrobiales bacterium]|nr:hypothetical protein [Hyphomicrobiales bacterium]
MDQNDSGTSAQGGIVLTPAQLRSRKARSIAIGCAVGALVIFFYALTIIKLGPHALDGGW